MSERASERASERVSERASEWPSTYILIQRCSEPQWTGSMSHSIHCLSFEYCRFSTNSIQMIDFIMYLKITAKINEKWVKTVKLDV